MGIALLYVCLVGGRYVLIGSWRHHERSPRAPIFISEREIKHPRCTLHIPVAIHPLNRNMSTPEGYRYSLQYYNRWGVGDFWWENAAKP
jgi:hypothetical protein